MFSVVGARPISSEPGWCHDRKKQGGCSDRSLEGSLKIMVGAQLQTSCPLLPFPYMTSVWVEIPEEDVEMFTFTRVRESLYAHKPYCCHPGVNRCL